jgi:hypothetical protein
VVTVIGLVDVEGGILREEAMRSQRESGDLYRHDREVLRSHEVR